MSRDIVFHKDSLDEFNEWKKKDPKVAGRIKQLLIAILDQPFEGIGKPEPLKHQLAGYWSRRITKEHRLVYKVTDSEIIVVSCKYHYK